MNRNENNELLLLSRMRCGDHQAFKSLFVQYYRALCHFAGFFLRDEALAEELVSDLFLKFWQARADVQVQNIRMYLYTATKNRCLNQLRKNKKEILVFDDTVHEPAHDDAGPLDSLISKETALEINQLINRLPEKMRACFVMSRIDGLSYTEIAELFDISVRTVEDHIYKALQILRRIYQQQQS